VGVLSSLLSDIKATKRKEKERESCYSSEGDKIK
jgi:hypothetical protein